MQRSIPYVLCVAIIGVFTLVILRKRFIIDYRLQFPSGTATGYLISSFHTPKGEAVAREQVRTPLLITLQHLWRLVIPFDGGHQHSWTVRRMMHHHRKIHHGHACGAPNAIAGRKTSLVDFLRKPSTAFYV
jgi:uncharacterized oligopeptide transporter (OPT) family protein